MEEGRDYARFWWVQQRKSWDRTPEPRTAQKGMRGRSGLRCRSRGVGPDGAAPCPVQSNCTRAGSSFSGRSRAISTVVPRGRTSSRPRVSRMAASPAAARPDSGSLAAPGNGANPGSGAGGGGNGANVLALAALAFDVALFSVNFFVAGGSRAGQAGLQVNRVAFGQRPVPQNARAVRPGP